MEFTALALALIGCVLLTASFIFYRHGSSMLGAVVFIFGTLFVAKACFTLPAVGVPALLIYTIAMLSFICFRPSTRSSSPSA